VARRVLSHKWFAENVAVRSVAQAKCLQRMQIESRASYDARNCSTAFKLARHDKRRVLEGLSGLGCDLRSFSSSAMTMRTWAKSLIGPRTACCVPKHRQTVSATPVWCTLSLVSLLLRCHLPFCSMRLQAVCPTHTYGHHHQLFTATLHRTATACAPEAFYYRLL
jgi:hypothetical protein